MSQRVSSVERQRASFVMRRMQTLKDPRRAASSQRFFRTSPGEYGHGDRFLGLDVGQIRALAREFADLRLDEVETLLESPWHEARLLAVIILANAYRASDARTGAQIYQLYLRRSDRINNWDLVDSSAPGIVGAHLVGRSRAPLRRLARSKSVWERRIAVVATQHLIRLGEFDDTLRLADQLANDEHDLIHKAVGWMLREVGNRDERTLTTFLDKRAGTLPRTTLRYAIERLAPAQRKKYMTMPRIPRARRQRTNSNPASEFHE
jgi:3-methyladenine DNA glycosylase AlkD